MTVPDELVQAVHGKVVLTVNDWPYSSIPVTRLVLDAVPDDEGWAKIDGEWVRLTDFPEYNEAHFHYLRRQIEQGGGR